MPESQRHRHYNGSTTAKAPSRNITISGEPNTLNSIGIFHPSLVVNIPTPRVRRKHANIKAAGSALASAPKVQPWHGNENEGLIVSTNPGTDALVDQIPKIESYSSPPPTSRTKDPTPQSSKRTSAQIYVYDYSLGNDGNAASSRPASTIHDQQKVNTKTKASHHDEGGQRSSPGILKSAQAYVENETEDPSSIVDDESHDENHGISVSNPDSLKKSPENMAAEDRHTDSSHGVHDDEPQYGDGIPGKPDTPNAVMQSFENLAVKAAPTVRDMHENYDWNPSHRRPNTSSSPSMPKKCKCRSNKTKGTWFSMHIAILNAEEFFDSTRAKKA